MPPPWTFNARRVTGLRRAWKGTHDSFGHSIAPGSAARLRRRRGPGDARRIRSGFRRHVRPIKPEPTRRLPLCSFGPGGSYIVDWQIEIADLADPRRLYPPRTIGSIIRRVAGSLLWDLKEWLIATHPRRAFRADHTPAALDPCEACGIASLWPPWFAAASMARPI